MMETLLLAIVAAPGVTFLALSKSRDFPFLTSAQCGEWYQK